MYLTYDTYIIYNIYNTFLDTKILQFSEKF